MRTPYMNYDMCYVFRCEQDTFPFFKILKKKKRCDKWLLYSTEFSDAYRESMETVNSQTKSGDHLG